MKKRELKEMVNEAHAVERGEIAPARVWKLERGTDGKVVRTAVNPEGYRRKQAREWKAKTEAARIRHAIDMTQGDFAALLGVPLGTVRKWESGAIEPSGAARTLLKIAAKHPEIVREAAAH